MEEKLRKFVEYHYRFNDARDKDQKIEEVYNKLLVQYNTLKDRYGDEERAYRETISHIDAFADVEREIRSEYTRGPRFYDVGMVLALVVSVFAMLAFFIAASLAFVLTVISIMLFSGSGYYIYHQAQYEKNVNGDIDRFDHYLDRSFSFLRTAFIFWAITFTILFGQLIADMFLFMEGLSDPFNTFTNFEQFVMLYFISFTISAAATGVLFYLLYDRFHLHYRRISGKDAFENEQSGVLETEGTELTNPIKPLLPWLMIMVAIFSLFMSARIGYQNGSTESSILGIMFVLFSPRYYFTGLFLIVGYAAVFYTSIKEIKRRPVRLKWIVISAVGLMMAFFLVSFILQLIGSVYFMFVTPLNPVIILGIGLLLFVVYALITVAMGSPLDDE